VRGPATLLFPGGLLLMLVLMPAPAPATGLPTITIIIDDIGYRYRDDQAALALTGPLAVAVLPHSPHGELMSQLALDSGKDVLLHLPMEAQQREESRMLGPGALTMDMDRVELMRTVNRALQAVPAAIGVNNHMGSLLTMDTRHMEWLMESLALHDKFYIDSVTSHRSVAAEVARRKRLPNLSRDVFLDNATDASGISEAFDDLVRVAHRRGAALAIGHPHPETIAVLREKLAQLDRYGVRLVGIRDMLMAWWPEPSLPMQVRTGVPGRGTLAAPALK